jgi:hypothetical protein
MHGGDMDKEIKRHVEEEEEEEDRVCHIVNTHTWCRNFSGTFRDLDRGIESAGGGH